MYISRISASRVASSLATAHGYNTLFEVVHAAFALLLAAVTALSYQRAICCGVWRFHINEQRLSLSLFPSL